MISNIKCTYVIFKLAPYGGLIPAEANDTGFVIQYVNLNSAKDKVKDLLGSNPASEYVILKSVMQFGAEKRIAVTQKVSMTTSRDFISIATEIDEYLNSLRAKYSGTVDNFINTRSRSELEKEYLKTLYLLHKFNVTPTAGLARNI